MRALAALAVVLCAATAHADDPARIYSVSAIVGYAGEADVLWNDVQNKRPILSQYRYGFGLRAGVSLPKFYLGAALVHHVGSTDIGRGPGGNSYDARYHTTLFGPEVGYDAHFGEHLLLRPYLGAGVAYVYSRTSVAGTELKDDHFRFHLTPGFILAAQVSRVTFGIDLRAVLSPIDVPQKWAPGAFATVGVRF